jgi:hypothetical protein
LNIKVFYLLCRCDRFLATAQPYLHDRILFDDREWLSRQAGMATSRPWIRAQFEL